MTKTRELKASSSPRPALSPPRLIPNLTLVPSVFRLSFSILVGYHGSISVPPGHAISRPTRGDGNVLLMPVSSPPCRSMLLSVDVVPSQALRDPLSAEDMELAMLYRNRVALARGHLCGAMWKDIDPERPH